MTKVFSKIVMDQNNQQNKSETNNNMENINSTNNQKPEDNNINKTNI